MGESVAVSKAAYMVYETEPSKRTRQKRSEFSHGENRSSLNDTRDKKPSRRLRLVFLFCFGKRKW